MWIKSPGRRVLGQYDAYYWFWLIQTDSSTNGEKGSSPYFQREIATNVLRGLIYHICELYVDDVLIDVPDDAASFRGLHKHRVAVNPKKSKLDWGRYVEHLVSSKDVSFTEGMRLEVKLSR